MCMNVNAMRYVTLRCNDLQVYAEGSIEEVSQVSVWLGANTMLEYPIDEARALMQERATRTDQQAHQLDADLDYLREQETTLEVNIARLHNWRVEAARTLRQTPGTHA